MINLNDELQPCRYTAEAIASRRVVTVAAPIRATRALVRATEEAS